LKRGWEKNVNPEAPELQDWQIVKSVLMDEQLMQTAKTKGAISDVEMAMFAEAVANDDLISMKRVLPVLRRALRRINADETSKVKAYKQSHGEDPYSWQDLQSNIKEYDPDKITAGKDDLYSQYGLTPKR
jgi:hypothetical protein